MDKRVVGVYENGEEAIRAVEDLKAQGYSRDDISVVAKDRDEVKTVNAETGTKTEEGLAAGAATGGILGGTAGLLAGIGALAIPGIGPVLAAGPIAATLAGAAVGAGTGGLAGALIGMGIPEAEAGHYETEIKSGKLLILVDPHAPKHGAEYAEPRVNVGARNDTLDTHRDPIDGPIDRTKNFRN